jgi:hypothetical protein
MRLAVILATVFALALPSMQGELCPKWYKWCQPPPCEYKWCP